MNTEDWVKALTVPGILLGCYLVVPPLLNFALGPADVIWGRPVLSYLAQAGLGAAVLYKLSALKGPLWTELGAWLGKFGQPPEKNYALAGKIIFTGGRLAAIALLLAPLAHMLPGGLAVIVTLAAVGYIFYAASALWRLYEPFVAKMPEAPEPEPGPEAPAAPERRCPKCGQRLAEKDEYCGFCHNPVPRQPGA